MKNQARIKEFLKEHELNSRTMGGGLDGPDNYSGENISDWIGVLGRTRDSEILDESNFESALATLGGEKQDKVRVIRIGHWGCGWIEYLAVRKNYVKGIKIAMEIAEQLKQYPVLDDEDFSDREREAMDDTFDCYKQEFTENAVKCLKDKTDIPLEILKEIQETFAFEILVHDAYDNDCGYRGYEDGFVTERNFVKALLNCCNGSYAHTQANTLYLAIERALGIDRYESKPFLKLATRSQLPELEALKAQDNEYDQLIELSKKGAK